jgi:hypothetical protein
VKGFLVVIEGKKVRRTIPIMRNCLVEAIYAERENSGLASKDADLPKSKREHPSNEFHDSCAGRPHVEGND